MALGDIASEELYRQVGLVFQDVQLLRMSNHDNIALARPDASRENVEQTARTAQIHDRILELPQGYDSVAGEVALLELVIGRTLLVIAYRLHTIVGADQICVLEAGQIIERGTHQELLACEGAYRRLREASQVGEVVG